jgi:ribonuclease HI
MSDPNTGSCILTAPSTSTAPVQASSLFISPRGEKLKYILQLLFKATKNAAEYEALIHGLRIAASLGIKRLLAYGDSKVVI